MGRYQVSPRAIGWAVKTHRTRPSIDLTGAALASKAGIKYMRLANIEAGRVTVTDGELRVIEKVLRVKAGDILALAKAGKPMVEASENA